MDDTGGKAMQEITARLDRLETVVNEIRALVGPFGATFPDGSMLVQTLFGTKYFIDPNDEIMAPQLIVYRQWESDLSGYMVNSVNRDTVFVDVGANFGYFTCLVASRIGNQGAGRVIAVEPNPAMQRLLRKNLKINWSMAPIENHDCAVTAESGFVEFSVPADRAANGSIASNASGNAEDRFIVRSRSLDELVPDVAVDIMKIDVEGFEAGVLKGAANTIRRSPNINIVIEWSLSQMKDAGFTADDLLDLIRSYDLGIYKIPHTRNLSDAEWANLEIPESTLRHLSYDNILLRHR